MTHDNSQSGRLSEYWQLNQRGGLPSMEPPILSKLSDVAVYDVSTMVKILRVRPLALWTWEQQLGISNGEPTADPNRQKRRYSERDLAALLWLRDEVIAGKTPQDAAARLLGAQRGMRDLRYGVSGAMTSGPLTLDPPGAGPLPGMTSGELSSGALFPPPSTAYQPPMYDPARQARSDDDWNSTPTGSLGRATYPEMSASGMRATHPVHSGPLERRTGEPWGSGARNAPPNMRQGGFSAGPAPQPGGASGRLGAIYGSALDQPTFPPRGFSMSQSLSSLRELRPAVPLLLQAFSRFDTARAHAIVTEALRAYGVENVCIGLAQPAVIRISELWSNSELSNPEERFGLNYLREFMFAVFHSTQEPMGAPFAVVGCAPNETNDFGALLLAVLWRRAGLRVAYLGRGIDGDQLVQEPWPITPAVIALTATHPSRIRAMARIAKKLGELPAPQPVFAYWGPVFVRTPDLIRKLGGVYLGDDAAIATRHVRQLVSLETFDE
jgi:methanogenic corrinoid protein MtbC1